MPKITRPQMESRLKGSVPLLRSDISQRDVARRMGVSSTTVSRWARSLAGGGDLKATKTPGRPVRLKRELIVKLTTSTAAP